MGSTHSHPASVEQPETHTPGNLAQHSEKLQYAKQLYDPSSLPQQSNFVRTSAIHPPCKRNVYSRLKKFATVAVNRPAVQKGCADPKSVINPIYESYSTEFDPKPSLTELEQLYLDMNIVTRVNKYYVGVLLIAFGSFVIQLCPGTCVKPTELEVAKWVVSMDKSLCDCGWARRTFIIESHIVFLFMLMERFAQDKTFLTVRDVRKAVHVCLFLSYTYNGDEISYPARPFLSLGQDQDEFFQECVGLGLKSSGEMLKINQDQDAYRRHLTRLLTYKFRRHLTPLLMYA